LKAEIIQKVGVGKKLFMDKHFWSLFKKVFHVSKKFEETSTIPSTDINFFTVDCVHGPKSILFIKTFAEFAYYLSQACCGWGGGLEVTRGIPMSKRSYRKIAFWYVIILPCSPGIHRSFSVFVGCVPRSSSYHKKMREFFS